MYVHGQGFWDGRMICAARPTADKDFEMEADSSHGPTSLSLHVPVKSVPVLRDTGERDV